MAMQYIKGFAPTVLTTAAATLFTVPDNLMLRGGILRFVNVTGTIVTVTAHAVPKAGVAGNGNAFVKSFGIPANGFYDVAVPVMADGDFIQALASAGGSITAHFLQGVLSA